MEHDDALIREIDEVLEAAHGRAMRIEPQLRRFARVLGDLGLPVPPDWATQDDPTTVEFGSLSPKTFDRLVCMLEDLAARVPVNVTIIRGGGPTLFDPPPAGPTPRPTPSGRHIPMP